MASKHCFKYVKNRRLSTDTGCTVCFYNVKYITHFLIAHLDRYQSNIKQITFFQYMG